MSGDNERERPAFGSAPIRCSKRGCKWRGYEDDMKQVPHPTLGSRATQNVCPTCGCDSYYFMTPKEVAAWEKAKAASAAVAGPVVGSTGADWQVVAWAVFAPNGNIRLWSTDREEVCQFAVKQALPLTPLYRKADGTKESAC